MQSCRRAIGQFVRSATKQGFPAVLGPGCLPRPLVPIGSCNAIISGNPGDSAQPSHNWSYQQLEQIRQHGDWISPRSQLPGAASAPAALKSSGLIQHGFFGSEVEQRRGFLGVGDGEEESGVSRHHEEERTIGYTPEQLYDVVAAVDLYQDFVPWCRRSTVLWRKGSEMEAELEIGFRLFNERYISHVHLNRPHLVKTTVSQSLLFDYLDNTWEFRPGPVPHSTTLRFSVAFQFRSALYRGAANLFFDEVVQQLVGAFENRCRVVYGPSRMVAGRVHAPLHQASHR